MFEPCVHKPEKRKGFRVRRTSPNLEFWLCYLLAKSRRIRDLPASVSPTVNMEVTDTYLTEWWWEWRALFLSWMNTQHEQLRFIYIYKGTFTSFLLTLSNWTLLKHWLLNHKIRATWIHSRYCLRTAVITKYPEKLPVSWCCSKRPY